VCRQLDGIPLALELAAARVRVLSVEQIAARLDNSFGVLAEGSRTAPERQRTLEAAVAWSYDLLSGDEQRLFNRLAVFRGNWSLEATEAICGDPDGGLVLDTLGRLVEKSLVVVEEGPHAASVYRMPETIRQFAAARLLASGEAPVMRERHFRWYVEFGLEAEQMLRFTPQPWSARKRWMERLNIELANLRAAWTWPLTGDGSPRAGLKLAAGLFPMFWTGIGMLAEGIDCYLALLERDRGSGPSPERAWALATGCKLAAQYGKDDVAIALSEEYWALPVELQTPLASGFIDNARSLVALHAGNLVHARRHVLSALEGARAAGDAQFIALLFGYLGAVEEAAGQVDEARAVYRESVERAREIDFPIAAGLGLAGLARLTHARGDHTAARNLYQQAQHALVDMGDMPQIAQLLADLGHLELERGNCRAAAGHFGESLELAVRVGRREEMLRALEGLGLALVSCEPAAEARRTGLRLLGASLRFGRSESDSSAIGTAISRCELVLGKERAATLVDEGRLLGLDEAIALARAALADVTRAGEPVPVGPGAARLSRREQEVLELLARGASNRQIADALVIAERTVEMHVSNILAKLQLTSRAQVAAWAADHASTSVGAGVRG
jgi:DNA-binding CsgD family transcriptional regulator/tetratricopeptide (TPR) repeat protein